MSTATAASTAAASSTAAPGFDALAANPAYPLEAPARIPGVRGVAAGQPGLTQAELEHFYQHGWVLRKKLISAADVAELGTQVDGLHEHMATPGVEEAYQKQHPVIGGVGTSWEEHTDTNKPKRIRQLMGSQFVSPAIDRISRSEAVLAVMRQLIGPDVYLYHSKLMMKAARDGSFTPWHQDFQYWQYESIAPTQVNCMLYIDGSDEANGCLRMIDGSNKRGLLPIHHIKSSSFSIGLPGELNDVSSTMIPTEPGDAIFFGSYVIHGSGPNTSDRHRRANTFAYDKPCNWLPSRTDFTAMPLSAHRCGAVDPKSV
jgi:ectoine hydroxylase-related dioxygenase (phytanoyl-CoA dioxygenase family)